MVIVEQWRHPSCFKNNHREDEDEDQDLYVPLKQRRLEKLQKYANTKRSAASSTSEFEDEDVPARPSKSLLDQTVEQRRQNQEPGNVPAYHRSSPLTLSLEKTEAEKRLEEERRIEEAQARHKALVSVQEAASGTNYTEPIKTSQVLSTYNGLG